MTPERNKELELSPDAVLTESEIKDGWHFCPDWDYMLVCVDTPEKEGCCCGGG